MKYRALGPDRLKVSEIAVGCSGFWGDAKFPEKSALAIIREAAERGVTFFDTGHNYSRFNAEPRLGRAIRELTRATDRSTLVISSKAGTTAPAAKVVGPAPSDFKNFSPDYIEQTCAKSIANLNCDYLDIFQLHGVKPSQMTEPLIERLAAMKRAGMFRLLGANTHDLEMMSYVLATPGLFDVVLLDYNLLQLDREPIIEALSRAGVNVIAGTALAQGHLIKGKIGSIRSSADLWYLARAVLKPAGRRLMKHSRKLREHIAAIPDLTPAQAAVAYVLSNPNIASCVFGTTKLANLREVIDASEKTLTDAQKASIRELSLGGFGMASA